MIDPRPARPPLALDEAIEAFEEAQARDPHADLAAFLPDGDHPEYTAILCELVRVDMELSFRRRSPRRLEEYRHRFPALFRDTARAREVAFEEFRLKTQAGEAPSASDYRSRFGGEVGDWPEASIARDADPESSTTGVSPRPSEALAELRTMNPAAASRLERGMAALPEVGGRFAGFQLRQELGRGAFGRVFLAEQGPMAGRCVALKVTADAVGEIHALSQLQHTNVVPIYSVHRHGPLQALCMPYLGASTLADVIAGLDRGKTLPDSGEGLLSSLADRRSRKDAQGSQARNENGPTPETATGPIPDAAPPAVPAQPSAQIEHLRQANYVDAILWLGLRLADGLAHAHERGILHRDLKPANVLFTDGGEPMLLDFNLAADLKLRVQTSGLVGGTLPYMAPEQLEAFQGLPREIDARSDLFSLGVILFELLTGCLPHEPRRGPVAETLPRILEDRRGPVPSLRSKNRRVSPAVEAIVRKCLDPDPSRRYESARQLADDLQRQIDHRALRHTPEPSMRERAAKWARRHPRLTSTTSVVLGSLVVVAALASGLLARQRRIDSLEARDSLARLESEVRSAEFLLGSREAPRTKIDEGIRVCRSAIDRYSATGDPRWRARPLFASLAEGDRGRVSRSLGELMGLWAQSEAWLAEGATGPEKSERLARASGLVDASAASFGTSTAPAVLTLIRADLARIGGRDDEARRLRDLAAGAPLRSPRERLLLVPDRLASGRDREALALAEEASRLDPLDPSCWLLRGHCLARLARPQSAIESYSVGLGLEPGYDWGYFDRGVVALESGDFPRAVEDFRRVLERRPELADARLNLALAKLGQGDAAGAAEDLEGLIDRPDAPARTLFILALAYDALGQPDRAQKTREQGLKRVPGDELSWVTRGLNRLPADPAGAVSDFDSALDMNPRSLFALQNRASVLSEILGRTDEAVKSLDLAVAGHPESLPALAGRGVLLARLGRRDEALRDAKLCLALDASADTLYRVACMYALTSKADPADRAESLRLLARAVRQDPAWLAQVPADTDLDPLRGDPEFARLVEALRLVSP